MQCKQCGVTVGDMAEPRIHYAGQTEGCYDRV